MVTLDQQSLAALASPTRLAVLKKLRERNHTISELASALDMAGPTIREHIRHLEHADLVTLKDSGHKWKYYTLTKRGNAIFSEQTITLDLAIVILSAAGLAASVILSRLSTPRIADATEASTIALRAAEVAPAQPLTILWIAIPLSIILIVALYRLLRMPR